MNIMGIAAVVILVWGIVCRLIGRNTKINGDVAWVFFIWGSLAIMVVGLSAVGLM